MDPIERALETILDGPDVTHAMGYHINARGELVREKRYHVIFHSILNIVYLILWQMNHLINRLRAMEYQVDTMDMMEVEDMCRQIDDQEPSDDLPLGPPLCEGNTLHLFPITRAERRSVIKLRKKDGVNFNYQASYGHASQGGPSTSTGILLGTDYLTDSSEGD